MPVNIENALKIDGWMLPAELTWLAEQASTRRHIVEVGSWMGRSTRALADNTSGVVYAVDTWRGTPGPKECGLLLADKPEDWLITQFALNIGTDLLDGPVFKVRPLQLPSVAASKYLGSECYRMCFDMIFIDAAHYYEDVKADLLAWSPLLQPGGLLCGHDFGGSFPGVAQAVTEVFPEAKRVGAGSIWAI